ncbi:syndecan-2-B [Austrofundulus limnaeus]|uniref:Syndecan n=1 Tax=Austrofundulus limnaeus TaxID=52670 RepID=A0A2I4CED6_AUSLI|nr:PREDICTED: syndecan-2-B-like [Austrofundulus limnaeus]
MKNLWFFFLVGLSAGSISKKLFVSSEPFPQVTDDLYIEGLPSGDSPVDDEGGDDNDDGSGSGSGDYSIFEDLDNLLKRHSSSGTVRPTEALPTSEPYISTTTAAGGQRPEHSSEVTESSFSGNKIMIPGEDYTSNDVIDTTTDIPSDAFTESNWGSDYVDEDVTKQFDNRILAEGAPHGRMHEINSAEGVTSENLWDRTDVLAAVIACGVVGFLCAVSLLLLLAYRMKKKDEGSYELGDTKLSATAYHKAPTKEFYA